MAKTPAEVESNASKQLHEPVFDIMRSCWAPGSSWDWWPSSLSGAATARRGAADGRSAEAPAGRDQAAAVSWAQATAQDSMAFTMTVQSVDYAALKADFGLLSAFATALQVAIGSEQGLGMAPSYVGFIGGPLIVQAIIVLPDGISASDLKLRLPAASAQLARSAAAALAGVEGIARASSGAISVSQISPPTTPALAGIQGTWRKESNMHVIRGSTVYFHNGGKTQVTATSASTFKLKHPTGVVLEATLQANGQALAWDVGSVWCRAAPDPHAELQRTLRESVLLANHAIDKRCDEVNLMLQNMHQEREQLARGWEDIRASRASLGEKMTQLQEMMKEVRAMPAGGAGRPPPPQEKAGVREADCPAVAGKPAHRRTPSAGVPEADCPAAAGKPAHRRMPSALGMDPKHIRTGSSTGTPPSTGAGASRQLDFGRAARADGAPSAGAAESGRRSQKEAPPALRGPARGGA